MIQYFDDFIADGFEMVQRIIGYRSQRQGVISRFVEDRAHFAQQEQNSPVFQIQNLVESRIEIFEAMVKTVVELLVEFF